MLYDEFVKIASDMYGYVVTCTPVATLEYVSVHKAGQIRATMFAVNMAPGQPSDRSVMVQGKGTVTYGLDDLKYYALDHMFRYNQTTKMVHIADHSISLESLSEQWMRSKFIPIPGVFTQKELDQYYAKFGQRSYDLKVYDWHKDDPVQITTGDINYRCWTKIAFTDSAYQTRSAERVLYVFDDIKDAYRKIMAKPPIKPFTIALTDPRYDNNVRGSYYILVPIIPNRLAELPNIIGSIDNMMAALYTALESVA